MKLRSRVFLLALVATGLLVAGPLLAQDPAMPEMTPEQMAEMQAYMAAGTPGAPHQALAAKVGSYDVMIKSWNAPDAPPMESKGQATRTMTLEGRVMVEEFSSTMMGMPFQGIGRYGYDNVTGEYWSTWSDSMSTGLMVSKGSCDADDACEFRGSWNDPVTKGKVESRMTSRWTSPTTELFEMFVSGKDGQETKMMEIVYTKQ